MQMLITPVDSDMRFYIRISYYRRTLSRIASPMLQGNSSFVTSVAFHPSAPYLVTGSYDNTAKLWLLSKNAATCVCTLQEHGNLVESVAFHPLKSFIVIGSNDGTSKLWR